LSSAPRPGAAAVPFVGKWTGEPWPSCSRSPIELRAETMQPARRGSRPLVLPRTTDHEVIGQLHLVAALGSVLLAGFLPGCTTRPAPRRWGAGPGNRWPSGPPGREGELPWPRPGL